MRHTHETCMRCALMRYMPMRCMPVRRTPMRRTPIRYRPVRHMPVEMHTREMYTREIYAYRSSLFGGYGGAGVARGCPRTTVFTLTCDDDVDSLRQTQ
jgi:hypothetical protein